MNKFFLTAVAFAVASVASVVNAAEAQAKVRLDVCTAVAKAYGGNWSPDIQSSSGRKDAYTQALAVLTPNEKKRVNLTLIARGEEAWNKGMEPYVVFRQYEQAFEALEQACDAQGDSPHALYQRAEQSKEKERQARIRQQEAELSKKK